MPTIIPLNLGDVNSEFSQQANGILISLNNQNGELDISGVINVSESGVYNADITLSRNATSFGSSKDFLFELLG